MFILPFSLQLGEELKQLVPVSGLTVMDLEAEGVCVRFSPLMTAAGNLSPWIALTFVLGNNSDMSMEVQAVGCYSFPL